MPAVAASPLGASHVLRSPSAALRVTLVFLALLCAVNGQGNPSCTESQYVNDVGECASCEPFAITDASDFTGPDSCVCKDNYYHDTRTGGCTKCPDNTVSVRGQNTNISSCECRANWVGTDGVCQLCGLGGVAAPPYNTDVSDCMCRNKWYGPPGTVGECKACPANSVTFKGSNSNYSDCQCKASWWGLGGKTDSCTQCGANSASVMGANSEISDCICKNNWYGVNGTCFACPAGSKSWAPNNFDVSGCLCPKNQYMVDPGTPSAKCERCGEFSTSIRGENANISGCICNNGYYGTDGECTKCDPNQVSTKGENFDVTSCKCSRNRYGTGGGSGTCTACPGRSSTDGVNNLDVSDCVFCRDKFFGTPVIEWNSDRERWDYIEGCDQCPDTDQTTRAPNNLDQASCLCPSSNKFWEEGSEVCDKCPGKTKISGDDQTLRPDQSIDVCTCPDRNWWGPVNSGNDKDCFQCEPFSKISVAETGPTSKTDCLCEANYYGLPGGTCLQCPAKSTGEASLRYKATSPLGSTEISDCACPKDFYGPVLRYDDPPPFVAWINEFHYDNDGEDVLEFVEIATLDGRNVAGLQIVLYNGRNGEEYDILDVTPVETGSGVSFTGVYVDQLQNGDEDGMALVMPDGGGGHTVIEYICYQGTGTVTATNGPAAGETCVNIRQYAVEGPNSPATSSIQRVGSAEHPVSSIEFHPSQFFWKQFDNNTFGAINVHPLPLRDAPVAWISEFHYDNVGADAGEFVEVATLDGEPPAGLEIVLYNGANGDTYGTYPVNPIATGEGISYTVVTPSEFQNGNDGIALVMNGGGGQGKTVLEFICYEGTFTAESGPANGMTCTNVGSEPSSAPEGSSIQRVGDGSEGFPSVDVWKQFDTNTKGGVNVQEVRSQVFQSGSYECRSCPVDKPFAVKGANEVIDDCLCKDNWYRTPDTSCEPCPSGSVSFSPNNIGVESCACQNNWYLGDDEKCTKCPNGGLSVRGENVGVESCDCRRGWFGTDIYDCTRCEGDGQTILGDNDDATKCSCGNNHYGLGPAQPGGCTKCPDNTKTVAIGVGVNVLLDSCSCAAGSFGPGYGSCTTCPDGSASVAGYNFVQESCACPDDSYGPHYGACTQCPMNGTSVSHANKGVFACQCPAGYAMAYMHYVDGVWLDPSCVPSSTCDGILDMLSGKCWKLFRDATRTWEDTEEQCQNWNPPTRPDALLDDADYFPTSGHLASIITREDLDMAAIIFDDFWYPQHSEFWIGANDIASEDQWVWSDGSTYSYVPAMWGTNQPEDRGVGEDCGSITKRWKEDGWNQRVALLNDRTCSSRRHGLCSKSYNRCVSGNNECSRDAECIDRDFGTDFLGYTCECHFGFLDVLGNGTVCEPANVVNCPEEEASTCHSLANCHIYHLAPNVTICSCPEGMIGDGIGPNGCVKNAWTVRAVVNLPGILPDVEITQQNKLTRWPFCKESIARLFFDVNETRPSWFVDAMHHYIEGNTEDGFILTLNGLFPSEAQAQEGLAAFNYWADRGVYACTATIPADNERRVLGSNAGDRSILLVSPDTVLEGTPGVYTWTTGTTGDPLQLKPTGFEVESVSFKPDCLATGCWVVDIIYTRGRDNFVTFYIPHALRPQGTDVAPLLPGEEDLSTDYDYDVIPAGDLLRDPSDGVDYWYWDWRKAPEMTFQPANFPCGSHDYDTATSPALNPPLKMTACCLMEFRQTYRPTNAFFSATADVASDCRSPSDDLLTGNRAWNIADPAKTEGSEDFRVYPTTGPLPADGLGAPGTDGVFAGMTLSRIDPAGLVDPYIGQYRVRLQLDERELREMAGKLSGTVGVEHVVDTFIGLAEFKPTGTKVLDSFATQTAIHLEKTSFFTVSTHGVNDYTFLEYINLRLVAVYDEDTDPTEDTVENGERTSRTNSTGAAHYVQVTFTLGAQYIPIETGLIPLDSVRVGQGAFIGEAFHNKDHTTSGLFHACSQYTDDTFARKQVFDARIPNPPNAVSQQCAPSAAMCDSPTSIPDQFVVFNIPLGIDWLPEPSSSLSENVFVDLVVSAIDDAAVGTPNSGDDAQQMKTTLTASIPVVRGGVNIFCDQITAKTDLVDVVKAHLIIGSAQGSAELSRLTIFQDIASSDMRPVSASLIDTDSIEAGLMTLILEGNASYFSLPGASLYGVQLEDVITLHFMEPADTKFNLVKALLATPGADNNDQNGLDTDGYTLNGAFRFVVDRVNFRAYLEPTDELLKICPFNPPRPSASVPFPSTCVQRRDIKRRTYPARNGGLSTAVEVPAQEVTDRHTNGVFMTTLLGDSDYSYALGQNFSQTVADEYTLNGQWKRAYMINPGYEWTPTQTGGQSIFTISQKIVLFALINLDEVFNLAAPAPTYTLPTTRPAPTRRELPNTRTAPARRMLLQKNVQNSNAGLSGAELTYQTSYKQIIASSYGIPDDRIATIQVAMQLDLAEACKSEADRHAALAATMLDRLTSVSSPLQNVLLLSHTVDMQGASCPSARRRSIRRNGATPTVDMEVLVAFATGTTSKINLEALGSIHGVLSVSELDVSPKVSVDPDYVPDHGITPTGPPGEGNTEDDSSSTNIALIAGICGGVGGLIIIVAVVMFMLRGGRDREDLPVVQAINTESLKAQLSAEC